MDDIDLLMNILSRLDTCTIVRSRLVSKVWYAASTSQHFLKHHYKPQQNDTLLWVLLGDDTGLCDLWRPFSGQKIRPTSLQYPRVLRGLSASNGLVCWRERNRIAVGNPLTNIWRWLDLPREKGVRYVGDASTEMVFNASTGIYKVSVAFGLRSDSTYMVYSSETETWSVSRTPQVQCVEHDWLDICGDIFREPDPCLWSKIQHFSYKGKEFVATKLTNIKSRVVLDVGVWEWEPDQSTWFMLSNARLLSECPRVVQLVGDVLLFKNRNGPLAFHMMKKRWDYARSDTCRGVWRYCQCAFVPNLVASPGSS